MSADMDEHVKKLEESRTERALLGALIDSLLDDDMNDIGGPLYNGKGADLGNIAARRMMHLRHRTLRQRFADWCDGSGFWG